MIYQPKSAHPSHFNCLKVVRQGYVAVVKRARDTVQLWDELKGPGGLPILNTLYYLNRQHVNSLKYQLNQNVSINIYGTLSAILNYT